MRKPQRPGCLRREGGNGGSTPQLAGGEGAQTGRSEVSNGFRRQKGSQGKEQPVESLGAAKGNKKGVLQIYQGKRNP